MLKPLNSGGPDAKTTPLIFSLAGLGSGVTEAILVNPFEVVKVKMQSSRAHTSEVKHCIDPAMVCDNYLPSC